MSRVVVLIDGEHYPPVVRFAIEALRAEHDIVAAAFAGGTEKVGAEAEADAYGVPVVRGASPRAALVAAIERYAPESVIDLSDEPVVSSADRFALASVALERGVAYEGADFRFRPPSPFAVARTPTLAIVGTGKRVGKTAISAYAARRLKVHGIDPVVLAMGRGGPDAPEVLHGDEVAITTADLLGFARQGRHAASDHYEDAVMSRVVTVGCRRCGGGMAGETFFSNVREGAEVADGLERDIMILEGSGAAVPPVRADATLLVVGAAQGPAYVTDYFGPLRLASADAVIVAGAEPPLVTRDQVGELVGAIRRARPELAVCLVTFRPRPLESVRGQRVFFATTAPAVLVPQLSKQLEEDYGCTVAAASPHLSDRARLRADLEAAAGTFDVLLTELKAASIDVVALAGEELGIPAVLCDNVPVSLGGVELNEIVDGAAAFAISRRHGEGA
jgi:cyclic 2,3-diphosphoglycerate synthase